MPESRVINKLLNQYQIVLASCLLLFPEHRYRRRQQDPLPVHLRQEGPPTKEAATDGRAGLGILLVGFPGRSGWVVPEEKDLADPVQVAGRSRDHIPLEGDHLSCTSL